MEFLRVTYRLDGNPAEAEARAEAIALEQTVEVPRAVAMREPFIAREIVGRVESVEPAADGGHRATIAYPVATTALDPAQLLGVLFGNSSLHADVQCVDFDPPPSLCEALAGPRAGIAGLRELTGVRDRALTCTAVKPMGRSPEALADLLRTFARAGIDVIKDDQGLADHEFCPFEARVEACLAAAEQVADETGHRALYVPNLIGTPERVFAQLRFAEKRGARAVMVSPMLLGLPDVLGALPSPRIGAGARAPLARGRAALCAGAPVREAAAALRRRRGDLRRLCGPLRHPARHLRRDRGEPARRVARPRAEPAGAGRRDRARRRARGGPLLRPRRDAARRRQPPARAGEAARAQPRVRGGGARMRPPSDAEESSVTSTTAAERSCRSGRSAPR